MDYGGQVLGAVLRNAGTESDALPMYFPVKRTDGGEKTGGMDLACGGFLPML